MTSDKLNQIIDMVKLDLCDQPNDISQQYLPYTTTLRQRQKAHAFSRNGYVHKVKLSRNENDVIDISAKVYRSQRKSETQHNINMTVNSCTKTITEGFCSCKSGISGECAHILAVLMTLQNWILDGYKEVPAEQSCTSLPQSWDKPRGSKIHPEPVSQMVICKPVNVSRKRKPLMAAFYDNRIKKQVDRDDIAYLQSLADSPIAYLASDPGTTLNTAYGSQYIGCGLGYHAPLMNPVSVPSGQVNPCGDLTFSLDINIDLPSIITDNSDYWTELEVNKDQCFDIEKNTRTQSNCELWHNLRKNRLTASCFGKIVKRKMVVSDKFLQSLFKPKKFVTTATSYGNTNEKVAKQLYMKTTENHVHDIGFIVNPAVPFLGATPDGKVCDGGQTGIIEIKCPYSVRDLTVLEACSDKQFGRSFFLKQHGNEVVLDTNHEYWYQVQGQLLLTGSPFCDFVTYTRKDLKVQRIFPNQDTFEKLLEKLANFYVNHAVPFLNADGNS